MSRKKRKDIVYSTNPDFEYEYDGEDQIESPEAGKQHLKIYPDRKNRGGKTVTVITGYQGNNEDIKALGKELKSHCGCGGTVKKKDILIQGNMIEKVAEYLKNKGYKIKISGI